MTSPDNLAEERNKPEITAELDVPIHEPAQHSPVSPAADATEASDTNLDKRIKLAEQVHNQKMDRDKFGTGKHLVFVCIAIMAIFALLDFFASGIYGESEILSNAFEVLKLVTMTALGYIFSSSKK